MSTLRSPDRKPTHPGAILREDVLPELQITQAQLAERLGVSRLTVSELLHERRALTPEMAVRLAALLNTSAESWLDMQSALSVWEARQQPGLVEAVKPIAAPPIMQRIRFTDSVPAALRRRRK